MSKSVCFIFFMSTLFLVVSGISAKDAEQKITVSELLETKCGQCHKTDEVKKMHTSQKSFLDIITKMKKKKNAEISNAQADDIARFLANPTRTTLEKKCTQCHGLDKIIDAHKKGSLTKNTIKKMQKKKGADISDKDADTIYHLFEKDFSVTPTPPVHPGTY